MKQLTFGSLFTGIGGLDLGLERAGLRCAWQVEIEEYPRQVLQRHWPDVPKHADIRDVGAHNLAPVDVLAGGFPCQDISNSGKKIGIEGARSGLWSEYARLICELRPSYVIVENVAALTYRGRGFQRVLGDLAARGYDAQWDVLPAAAFGAPHVRERVFVVAYPRSLRGRDGDTPPLFQRELSPRDCWGRPDVHVASVAATRRSYRAFPEHLRVDDGLSKGLEPSLEFGAERIKGCGNAVVPQVAEHVANCLLNFHNPSINHQAAPAQNRAISAASHDYCNL